MKCKINYELSKMQEFKSDPTKKYLQAVFVPVGMGLLQGLASRNAAQLTMNIFPGRDKDGNIDAEQSKALQEAYDNHTFDESYYVARVPVTVEPFLMTYTTDTATAKKGEIIKDEGGKVRKYDYVSVTSFMVLDANNQEVPLLSENELRSRANSVRNFRIRQGQWYDLATYNNGGIPEPTDDDLPPTEDLTATKPEDDAEYQKYLAQKKAAQKPERIA